MSTMQSQQQRGGCLTIWLVLAFIGGIFSVISYLTSTSTFIQAYPTATSATFILLAIASALIVIGAVGLWMWKRWGFYAYVAGAIVAVVANFTIGIGLAGLVGALIGLGILWFLIRNKWDSFV
ncbi:MAG TPA: hypothetical protein VHD90_23440 [Phototrophicaceae bacterium]|nr:hypothetical protein [Phototrophicaceae bacterium]